MVLSNRKGGPEGIIDMIESRAPEGFDDIDGVATYTERRTIVQGYARMAGVAPARVTPTFEEWNAEAQQFSR
jgi:hypothetical protein